MELHLHLHRPSPPQAYLWPSLRPPSLSQTLLLLAQPSNPNPVRVRSFPSSPRAYFESPKPFVDFLNKIRGSLPIVGLLSRILSDEGGVGNDRVQLIEFCTRVYRSFSFEQSTAFYEFEERHGTVARPQYVLIWCWAAALGAGLLKTEDFMLGASRLRASFDIKYEEDTFNLLMDEAAEKRRLSKSTIPFVPFEARAAKALDAICKCCIGRTSVDEEDARLLTVILQAVFLKADKAEVERAVRDKMTVAVGESTIQSPEQVSEQIMQTSVETKQVRELDPDMMHSVEELTEEPEQGVQDVTQPEEQTRSFV